MKIVIGVYVIKCVVSGKVYVGSSINVAQRWEYHQTRLRCGKHSNRHLQASWLKHGSNNFTFSLLKSYRVEQLEAAEQWWMNRLKAFGPGGYNLAPVAGTTRGVVVSTQGRANMSAAAMGRKLSETTKAKLRLISTGYRHTAEAKAKMVWAPGRRPSMLGRKHSPETLIKMSVAARGRKISIEQREKISMTLKLRSARVA